MRTQRSLTGARLLAILPMPVLCVLAALLGVPAAHIAQGPAFQAVQPVQSSGWGDRTAPAGTHQLERERTRASSGFQSSFALTRATAFAAPAGAAPLAEAAHSPVLAQRSEGAHFGRSPPRRS
jgi:hypothetical protein